MYPLRLLHDYDVIYEVPSVLNNHDVPGEWGLQVARLEESTDDWQIYRCHSAQTADNDVEIKVYRNKCVTDGENLRLAYVHRVRYDEESPLITDEQCVVFEIISGDYESAINPYPEQSRNEQGLVCSKESGIVIAPDGEFTGDTSSAGSSCNESTRFYEAYDEDTCEAYIYDCTTCKSYYELSGDKVKNFLNPSGGILAVGGNAAVDASVPASDNSASMPKGFASVAGMQGLKQQLEREVLFPLRNKELMLRYRVHPLNGMLLYGPPGCGKSYIAQKFAEESGMSFEMVSSGSLSGKYAHETANAVKNMFARAAIKAPCVLCIDEIDALCPNRIDNPSEGDVDWNESVNEFLTQMNNCSQKGIFVIGTTNNPTSIDSALLRTGRMDKLVYVPLPDEECRRAMLELHLKDRPQDEGIDLTLLAKLTKGMSASDIEHLVNAVALEAAFSQENITYKMLSDQARTQRRSVSDADVKRIKHPAISIASANPRPMIGFTACHS